ncbi:MAG: GNAT family N-acetyltransferase [Pseudomonadota bacterium]
MKNAKTAFHRLMIFKRENTMQADILVRRATPEDVREVIVMVDDLLHEVMGAVQQQAFNFDTEKAAHNLKKFIEEDAYFVYIARTLDGSPASCITMEENRALYAGGVCGTLREFYVRPELRSGKIGLRLLEEAKAFGKSRGWTRLEVTTPPLPQFERTLAFYERQGFTITGGRKLKLAL